MPSVPLHPMLVHLPLALAVLVPPAAIIAWRLVAKGRLGRGGWAAVVIAQAVLVVGAVVALRSGGAEGERVEDRVSRAAIERHEEAAELFVWGAGAVLLVGALGLVGPVRTRRMTMLVATTGTLVVAGLAVRTGKAGGELVYVHGAAGPAAVVAGSGVDTDDQ
jgi:uncharacterized membrane protein